MIEAQVSLQARLNPAVWAVARALDAVRRTDAAAERAWQDRLDDRLGGCRGIVARLEAEGNLRPGLDAADRRRSPVDHDVAADVGGPRARAGLVAQEVSAACDAAAARDADAQPFVTGTSPSSNVGKHSVPDTNVAKPCASMGNEDRADPQRNPHPHPCGRARQVNCRQRVTSRTGRLEQGRELPAIFEPGSQAQRDEVARCRRRAGEAGCRRVVFSTTRPRPAVRSAPATFSACAISPRI